MDTEKKINVKLDTRIQAYQSFYNAEWAKKLLALAGETKLEDAATALCVSWFATANAFAMPWRMVQNLIGFEVGFVRGEKTFADRILQRLAILIPQRMGGSLSNMKRQQLSGVIKEVGAEYQAEMATVLPTDAESLFAALLNGSDGLELQTSISSSQKTCYGAMYYAYECFLTTCVGIAKGDQDYRCVRFKDFKADVRAQFGIAIVDVCMDQVVNIARLARNALAHNGGKVTDELKALPHDLPPGDGDNIHIVTAHNHNLFNALKDRAYIVAEKAVTMPQFR